MGRPLGRVQLAVTTVCDARRGPRATVTRSAPRAPAAAEDDTDLANPTIDTIEVCDLGAHAPTFTPSAQ